MATTKAEADLAAVKAEIQRLERALEAARHRATKIEHYIEMARVYGGGLYPCDSPPGDELETTASSAVPQSQRHRSGKGNAVVNTVIEILRQAGDFMRTRDILVKLSQQGVAIGGGNQVTNLSGYLSRSELLENDRSLGWALKEWELNPPNRALGRIGNPQSAPALTNVAMDGDSAGTISAIPHNVPHPD